MQYLLSKDELDNLVPKKEVEDRVEALELARKRILEVSQFRCMYDVRTGYCDSCPCLMKDEEAREYESTTGHRGKLYEKYTLICGLRKSFSK